MAVGKIPHKEMKVDHIAIYVSDLEAAKIFFEKYFCGRAGSRYHNPKTGLMSYFMTFDNGCRIELMSRPEICGSDHNPYRCGYIHISFSVGDRGSVDNLTKRLADDGFEVISGPRVTGDGYYESCIRAFEGNLIEITV